MGTCLIGFLISLSMTGLGLLFFRVFQVSFRDPLERLVFSGALGAGITAYFVFIAGSFGFLKAEIFWSFFGAVLLFSSYELLKNLNLLWGALCKSLKAAPVLILFIVPIPLAVIGFTLLGVAAPETGHDALSYHLVQPLRFIQAGSIIEVPYSTQTLWPSLMQMLFTVGILLKDSSLAKFFHFFLYLCAAGAVFSFCRISLGKRAAFFSAVLYLTTPGFYIQAAFSYVDNALACFIFMSFYAIYRFAETRHLPWALLAGIFSGLALSVKLIGLFILAPMGGFLLFFLFKEKADRSLIWKAITGYTFMLFLFGGLWYLRSAILRGNPVFPFYPDIFGAGWNDPTYVDAHGRGKSIADFLLLLWDLTLYPRWFGGEHIGPAYLAFLPMIPFFRPVPGPLKAVLFFGIVYTVLWFLTDQNVRFFYPALTFFVLGAGYALSRFTNRPERLGRSIAVFLVFFLILIQSSFAAYHFHQEAVLFLKSDKNSYLLRNERTYQAARYFDGYLTARDKVLSAGEVRSYYFTPTLISEGEFHLFTGYDASYSEPEALAKYLTGLGFTHVLFAEVDPGYPDGQGPGRIARVLQENASAQEFFEKITEFVLPSKDGRYTLYQIHSRGDHAEYNS